MKLEQGNHTIRYACKEFVLISCNGDPVAALTPGIGKFNLRDFEGIIEYDPSKVKVRLSVVTRQNRGEAFDDTFLPQPAPPPNYLAALRQKVKQSMGVTREAFADFRSIYEVIDNLDDFEEDRQPIETQQETPDETVRQPDTSPEPEQTATTEE